MASAETCELLCLDLETAEALRRGRLDEVVLAAAAERGRALAAPVRLAVLVALRDGGELCVCDLAWVTERSQALVSHHVGVLREAGLVRARREGKMVMYSITDEAGTLIDALPGAARQTA